ERRRMNEWLPVIFMVLMGAAVLAYVILDGYDLGVGMLMPAASQDEQSIMVASIGPFWDANETWLLLGLRILLAAFPPAQRRGAGRALPARGGDARGPHVPRRRVRDAHQGQWMAPRALELALLGRLLHGVILPGRDAGALHHRIRKRAGLLVLRMRGGCGAL